MAGAPPACSTVSSTPRRVTLLCYWSLSTQVVSVARRYAPSRGGLQHIAFWVIEKPPILVCRALHHPSVGKIIVAQQQHPRFTWYHTFVVAGLLLGFGASTSVFIKRCSTCCNRLMKLQVLLDVNEALGVARCR